MHYGLRYFDGQKEVRLTQISGGGRVLVSTADKSWWISPKGKPWEVYEAPISEGQTYGTIEVAQEVASNLTGLPASPR